MTGTLDLNDPDSATGTAGDLCSGTGGYDDIANGAEVVISDDTGHTLDITTLTAGSIVSSACDFKFESTIPAGKGFYGITVTHRGTVKFTETEMQNPALTLGNG